jgi:hypothetical protein
VGDPEPIPADLREAFDHAVDALIAWESGDEPTITVHGRPTLISVSPVSLKRTKTCCRGRFHANACPPASGGQI